MRPTTPYALLPLLALALLPRPGTAQVQFDGLEFTGGYAVWESHAFTDVLGGVRFTLTPLLRLGERWGAGIEGVWAKSEIQFSNVPVFLEENGLNGVVRRYFGDPEEAHVFLQARGGWTRLEGEAADGPEGQVNVRDQSGFAAGGEVGVGFPASRYIDVVWAGGFAWHSYRQCEAFGPTYIWHEFGEDCSAIRPSVRIGIVIGRGDG